MQEKPAQGTSPEVREPETSVRQAFIDESLGDKLDRKRRGEKLPGTIARPSLGHSIGTTQTIY